jgi:hypothetical protein
VCVSKGSAATVYRVDNKAIAKVPPSFVFMPENGFGV